MSVRFILIGMAIILGCLILSEPASCQSTIIVDDDNGSWVDCNTIGDAINLSIEGDIIHVYNGTYYENIVINKTLTILGNSSIHTRIISNTSKHVVSIIADHVDLSRFNITNSSLDGIRLDGVENCRISNVNASNNDNGIYINSSHNNTIEKNTCHSNNIGILVKNSINNIFSNNYLNQNNDYGIYVNDGSENTILGNVALFNERGILISGSNALYNDNNHIEDNIANNNSYGICIFRTLSTIVINNNASSNENYGIYVAKSDYCEITENNGFDNYIGIKVENVIGCNVHNNTLRFNLKNGISLQYFDESIIANNIVTDNKDGIGLDKSVNSTIAFNFLWNVEESIYLFKSHRNEIMNNTMKNSSFGLYSTWSNNNSIQYNELQNNSRFGVFLYLETYDNSICFNNFRNNGNKTSQGYDSGSNNAWDDGSQGNYWSDYNGSDDDGDGIGDTPYHIDGPEQARDDFPLWESWSPNNSNHPPSTPIITSSSNRFQPNSSYDFQFNSSDPEDSMVRYFIDWGDGGNITTGYFSSGTPASQNHWWISTGNYSIRAIAINNRNQSSNWSDDFIIVVQTFENLPPFTPQIVSIPLNITTNVTYDFYFNCTEPDGDAVRYVVDWGEGVGEIYNSELPNTTVIIQYEWTVNGTYNIRVAAVDVHNAHTNWSDNVTIEIQWELVLYPPSPPKDVSVENRTDEVLITWSEPSRTGGSPIIGYRVYRNTTADSYEAIADVGINSTSFLDLNVSSDYSFKYYVMALNSEGESERSTIVTARQRSDTESPDEEDLAETDYFLIIIAGIVIASCVIVVFWLLVVRR